MPKDPPRAVLLDTNVLVSALKRQKDSIGTLSLILTLLDRGDVDLIGDPVLLHEYARHAEELASPTTSRILTALVERVRTVDPEERHIRACAPHFPAGHEADCVHAAACHKTGAVLISNDRHFDKVARAGLMVFLRTSEAVRLFAGRSDTSAQ